MSIAHLTRSMPFLIALALACGDKDSDTGSSDGDSGIQQPSDSGGGDGGTDSGEPAGDPDIQLSEDKLSFGSVEVGKDSSKLVTISNVGMGPLSVSDVALSDTTGAYTVDVPSAVSQIAAGAAEQFTVGFFPTETGTFEATVVITSDDPDSPEISLPLSGSGSNL